MSTLASPSLLPERGHPLFSLGLALLVHVVLVALLLWGFRWTVPDPKPLQVELWSAPAAPERRERSRPRAVTPPPAPPQPAAAEPEPEAPTAAEINRRRPQKPEPKAPARAAQNTAAKTTARPAEDPPHAKASNKPAPAAKAEPRHIPQPTAEDEVGLPTAATERPAAKSQTGSSDAGLLDEYKQRVSQLLQSRVILPQEPAGNPVAEFRITVLTSMVIANHEWISHSGDAQWDNAAEKAILMSKQLPPLPAGLSYGPGLRTMRIKLCPKTCR